MQKEGEEHKSTHLPRKEGFTSSYAMGTETPPGAGTKYSLSSREVNLVGLKNWKMPMTSEE
jgi:hypothetical protein